MRKPPMVEQRHGAELHAIAGIERTGGVEAAVAQPLDAKAPGQRPMARQPRSLADGELDLRPLPRRMGGRGRRRVIEQAGDRALGTVCAAAPRSDPTVSELPPAPGLSWVSARITGRRAPAASRMASRTASSGCKMRAGEIRLRLGHGRRQIGRRRGRPRAWFSP